MKTEELLEIIIKELVLKPEKVEIEKTVDEMGVLLSIKVDPDDRKLVIGKKGTTWRALRVLMQKVGLKNHQRVHLKLIEE